MCAPPGTSVAGITPRPSCPTLGEFWATLNGRARANGAPAMAVQIHGTGRKAAEAHEPLLTHFLGDPDTPREYLAHMISPVFEGESARSWGAGTKFVYACIMAPLMCGPTQKGTPQCELCPKTCKNEHTAGFEPARSTRVTLKPKPKPARPVGVTLRSAI